MFFAPGQGIVKVSQFLKRDKNDNKKLRNIPKKNIS